jgi:hypothetical protein
MDYRKILIDLVFRHTYRYLSTHSLDVTAVYTAGKNGGEVESIDVEQIRERKIE